jgi:hypothetical protein
MVLVMQKGKAQPAESGNVPTLTINTWPVKVKNNF